jgi:hypothetical protein
MEINPPLPFTEVWHSAVSELSFSEPHLERVCVGSPGCALTTWNLNSACPRLDGCPISTCTPQCFLHQCDSLHRNPGLSVVSLSMHFSLHSETYSKQHKIVFLQIFCMSCKVVSIPYNSHKQSSSTLHIQLLSVLHSVHAIGLCFLC